MKTVEEGAKLFLNYSFKDIGCKYEKLTPAEKQLCTPEEYQKLVAWIATAKR